MPASFAAKEAKMTGFTKQVNTISGLISFNIFLNLNTSIISDKGFRLLRFKL